MPGLYVPRSYHEQQEARRAQLAADWYASSTPDFSDAMELQRRLQLRDPRLSVTWGSAGPHMNRWVIIRQSDTGEVHVVKVFQNQQGEYERPEPSVADNLQNISGRIGYQMLREIEAEEARQHRADEQRNEEFFEDLGDRLATDIRSAAGVKDSILVSKDLDK